jgi:hypothetical protein
VSRCRWEGVTRAEEGWSHAGMGRRGSGCGRVKLRSRRSAGHGVYVGLLSNSPRIASWKSRDCNKFIFSLLYHDKLFIRIKNRKGKETSTRRATRRAPRPAKAVTRRRLVGHAARAGAAARAPPVRQRAPCAALCALRAFVLYCACACACAVCCRLCAGVRRLLRACACVLRAR